MKRQHVIIPSMRSFSESVISSLLYSVCTNPSPCQNAMSLMNQACFYAIFIALNWAQLERAPKVLQRHVQ